MDLTPKQERLVGKSPGAGDKLPKPAKKKAEKLLQEGVPTGEVAALTGVDKHTVSDIRKNLEDEGKLDVLAFKRRTAARLASFIGKAVDRLDSEVDSIPISQLMLPTAIAIDKFNSLGEVAPTVTVKAELRLSADDINRMLNANVIDVPSVPPAEPPKEIQGE
jgi:hypothetical protein